MKVEKVNARDIFDDDNDGYIFGLQEVEDFKGNAVGYIEWFKTEKARNKAIKLNKFKVVN